LRSGRQQALLKFPSRTHVAPRVVKGTTLCYTL